MPGGLEGPLHAKLRDELAKDPESKKWAEDVQKLDALLRAWPEGARADEAWEGLAARISQRLSEALPAGLDFTTPPFFDDEDARTGRPDASSGRVRTHESRREIEAKRAEFSLAKLSHLDAPKSAPPPPPAGNPQLEIVPSGRLAPAALPKPIARPPVEERFSFPTFSTPLAPLPPPPALVPATEKSTRGRWLLLGGAGFAAAAVVLLAVLVVPGLSSDAPDATLAATAVPMAAEEGAPPAMAASPVVGVPTGPPEETNEAAAGADRMPAQAAAPAPTAAPVAALAPASTPRAPAARGLARPSGGAPPAMAVSPVEQSPRARPAGGARTGAGGGGASGGGGGAPGGGGAATARGGSKVAVTAGPLAAAPSRADILAAMGSVRSAVAACAGGRGGVATVRLTFSGPTGRVMSAVVEGQFAGTPQGSCIARAVRAASVPHFAQSTVAVTYPFTL